MVFCVFRSRACTLLLAALCLAVVSGAEPASASTSSMDVVLVVDTSGSMAWDVEGRRRTDPGFSAPPRIDRVIDALKRYAAKLPEGARIRLISFNTGVKTNREFVISTTTRPELITAIDRLKREVGSGDTWLWEAMREGIKAAEVYASADPDLSVTLYVLTDGEYDNKTSKGEISLGKVLDGSRSLGGDSLYASLVLLGKPRSQGGSFGDGYVEKLRKEAGNRCDVEMDDDFDPLFPPILEVLPDRVIPNQKVSVIENSAMQFARVEWLLNGAPAGSLKNLVFTPPKSGRYEVTFRGFDKSGRRARATKVLNVMPEPVQAVPVLAIDGKPFGPGSVVTRGQTLALSHTSAGPVAKAEWSINGEKTAASTLSRVLDTVGEHTVTLTVESAPGPDGEISRSTSQAIVFEVVAQPVKAVVGISINGQPLETSEGVFIGDIIQLRSESSGPVKSAVWSVNGQQIPGDTVQWPVTSAGDVKISLTVSDPEFGQTDVSEILSLAAMRRPSTWPKWVLGISHVSLLLFFSWLLTGNRARDSLLLIEGGGQIHPKRFFSRFRKTAIIPMRKAFPRSPYWRERQDHEAFVVSRNALGKPAVKLGCTFATRGGDVSFGQDTGRPPTSTEAYYILEDSRDSESPQQVELTLRASNASYKDAFILFVIAASLVASFFYLFENLPI